MAEKVMDSLVDRILELESMTETISANDRRFIAVDDTDAPCRQDRSYDKEVITRLFSYQGLGRHQPLATASG